MSTRQLQTKATGTLALLSALALIAVAVTWRPAGGDADAAALAAGQQERLADMDRQLEQLVEAEDFAAVNTARSNLSRSVLAFDRTLEALVRGGTVAGADGRPTKVRAVSGDDARRALSGASALWLQVGMPLADLAAGDYSVFSASGQQAVRGLRENSGELSSNLAAVAAACNGTNRQTSRSALIARTLAGACLLALSLAMALRRRALRPAAPDGPAVGGGLAPAGAVSRWTAAPPAAAPAPRPAAPALQYKSPVDFEDVSAAVDQMTVDMSTIAASTEKMRTAIDSVGVALQGMIYRLNDLGDDTAEGYRLVRGANNAAGYTSEVAAELAENVREMGTVVSRVTQLAQKCRQTAAAIDQEAAQTGRTGADFTGAVAGQVKALAAQTSNATAEVEQTVSEMLARTREYEEAVAQILKHVSAIHRVSQNLGQVVLDPPASAVVGAPRMRATLPVPAAAAEPVSAPAAPPPVPAVQTATVPEPDETPEPTTAELADETAAAIEDATGPQEPAYDPDSDELPAYEKPKVTFSLDAHEADAPPPPPPAPRTSVFMLNRPKVPAADAVETVAEAVAAPAAAPPPPTEPIAPPTTSFEASVESAAEPEPSLDAIEPAAEPVAPVDEAPAESGVADDAGSEPAVSDGPRPNIFMLNDPKQTPKPRITV